MVLFTIVYDGSSLRLYVNEWACEYFSQSYFGPIKNNKYSFRIGKRTLEDGIDENFKLLDDVAIYNRALTQDEITT
jgi:hypothetical protein